MKTAKIVLFFIVTITTLLQGQDSKIFMAEIDGEIDLGMAPFVRRVVDEAEEADAEAIIFRINTFGGRVDAATQIKDAIINSEVFTIGFIDKRAISAGSLIALSCDKIVMVPGASVGATTVVDQTGKKQSEKYQSYMRSEMRSTAERNKRRKDIAEGMVDERVVVEGLVDSTQLITLTSEEALEYGIADTILAKSSEVIEFFELHDSEIVTNEMIWAEDVVRFINNPIISSLLIMIGIFGLFTEIKTPGWGVPGTAGAIALAIFFGAGYVLESASVIEIVIFIIGVILLLIEIFIVPGFGVFGILGIISMVAGLFLGLVADFPLIDFDIISVAIIQLAASFLTALLLLFLLSKTLPKTNIWNKLILQANIEAKSGYTAKPDFDHLVGKKGLLIPI